MRPCSLQSSLVLSANYLLSTSSAGKADEVERLLKECRRAAENDEANTHSECACFNIPLAISAYTSTAYRTTRGADGDTDKFVVFEEYTLPNGLTDHVANEPFQALAGADVIADLNISYYNEFQ